MRTIVYVDGFNLYYGALRGTPFRWLDIERLCGAMLARHDICRINYFTALVKSRPGDPAQPVRQAAYLRALRTLPSVRIHLGHYLSHPVWLPLAEPTPSGPRFVRVVRTEEKGSDVNLATMLISDAYEREFESAVLITNDSDLKSPVELVRDRLRLHVGILNPRRSTAVELSRVATFVKRIRSGVLRQCQLPEVIPDAHGLIRKPASW